MIASLPIHSGGGGGGGGGGGDNGGVGGGGGSNGGPSSRVGRGLALHRSNSSLELPHSPDPGCSRVPETPLRREYGSHGKNFNEESPLLSLKFMLHLYYEFVLMVDDFARRKHRRSGTVGDGR